MHTLKHKPKYTDFSKVVSNTVPGLAFSISELLARTVRGERLPGFAPQQEVDNSPAVNWSDKASRKKEFASIEEDMDKDLRNPLFQADSDIIEAGAYVNEVDEKYDL